MMGLAFEMHDAIATRKRLEKETGTLKLEQSVYNLLKLALVFFVGVKSAAFFSNK